MKVDTIRLCGILLVTFGLACSSMPSEQAIDERCKTVGDRRPACPITRRPPQYPKRAFPAGGEAVVLVSFSILEDGLTDDVSVVAILGHSDFGQAAIRAVKQWRYEPAIVAGVPVAHAKTRIIIPFMIRKNDRLRGAKRPFVKRFNQALADLEDGNLQSVREAVASLEKDPWPNLYEMSRLALLDALLAGVDGDLNRVVEKFDEATVLGGKFIGPKLYLYARGKAIRALLLMDRYGDAYLALGYMEERLGGNLPQEFEEIRRVIEDIRVSTEPFSIDGEIPPATDDDGRAVWNYSPLRRSFTIEAFDSGLIDEITVSCEWHREVFPPTQGRVVVLPASWGNCSVEVVGRPSTPFKFVEHTPAE